MGRWVWLVWGGEVGVDVVVRSCGRGEVRVRRWVWDGGCGEVGVVRWVWEVGVVMGVRRWVWGGGCGEVGVGRWVWGGGCWCGEVGVVIGRWVWEVGVVMENPTPVQKFTYLEPDSIISSLFVQSVIAVWPAKQIGGCGEVCVGVVVRSCGFGEVCVCGEVCVR